MQEFIAPALSESRFKQERDRLLAALGMIVGGGLVEEIEHIGASSLPASPASARIDIALAVWPFPLEPHVREILESLGYHPVPGYLDVPEQRFLHTAGAFQLFIVAPGTERWTNFLILGDYLRHDAAALQMYTASKQAWENSQPRDVPALQAGKAEPEAQLKAKLFATLLDGARRWWVETYGFGPVEAVMEEMEELACPWYISGGWALDLFLGRVSRVHQDIDIVIARKDQLTLQEYLTSRGWKLITPFEKRLSPWPPHMRLELPRHQVHAHRDGAFIDFLLSDIQDGVWRYRREPAVLRAVDRISLKTPEGIPFLAPELVLLFKSKNTSDQERSKDWTDFERAWPSLDFERRAWLRWALAAADPEHAWIERLA